MLLDNAGFIPSTSVFTQPQAVANFVVAPPQTTMATKAPAYLGTIISNMILITTAVSSAPAYIPPARRYYIDSRLIHG